MNTFRISRLEMLLRQQYQEHKKAFILCITALTGVVFLFYAINITIDYQGALRETDAFRRAQHLGDLRAMNFRTNLLSFSYLIFTCLLTGNYYFRLARPQNAIQELMLPVSAVERWLCGYLLGILLIITSFIVIVTLVDGLAVLAVKQLIPNIGKEDVQQLATYYAPDKQEPLLLVETLSAKDFGAISFLGLLASSFFLLGSIYFTRTPYLLTAFSLMVLSIFVFSAANLVDILSITRGIAIENARNNQIMSQVTTISFLVLFGSLWAATYYRIKEKQI